MNTYINVYSTERADSRIIAQHDGDHTADRYFYLHDWLGSVRQVIDIYGVVKK